MLYCRNGNDERWYAASKMHTRIHRRKSLWIEYETKPLLFIYFATIVNHVTLTFLFANRIKWFIAYYLPNISFCALFFYCCSVLYLKLNPFRLSIDLMYLSWTDANTFTKWILKVLEIGIDLKLFIRDWF